MKWDRNLSAAPPNNDSDSQLPRRDADGGIAMEVRPLPPYARVGDTRPVPIEASTDHSTGDEEQPPAAKKDNVVKMERPLQWSSTAATIGRRKARESAHPKHNNISCIITCQHCNRVFETTWISRPSWDELRQERERILNSHHCQRKERAEDLK